MEKINIAIKDTIETGAEDNNIQMTGIDVDYTNNIQNNENTKIKIKQDYRRIIVPSNRLKPLKENWVTIVKALVDHMKIQVKMNVKMKCVEIRSSENTEDVSALQKSEEFLKAFMCGFDLQDSIAMLRLEDLYSETFEIKDGKLI